MSQTKHLTNTNFLGHPKGLFILSLTEMWERFSFYGMRAILVLFLVDRAKGGLGWEAANALELYGIYTMAVYVLGIPGGFIADRYIGRKAAVLWGGILACIGHFLLAMQNEILFMVGLFFIASGTGLLKPNISTLIGDLYAVGDQRRDSGFTIFYMGINLGGLLSSLAVGYVGQVHGWHYGFGLAGVCMLFGIVIFLAGQRYLAGVGVTTKADLKKTAVKTSIDKTPFTKEEKDRIWALVISFIAIFTFFMAFEQAGGLMNLYAENYTNRYILGWEVPASMFQAVNPIFIVLLGPIVEFIWLKIASRYTISSFYKLGIGNVMVGVGFLFMVGAALQRQIPGIEKASLHWLINAYLFHTIGELCLSPVSLSFVTKLAPQRIGASIMGIYFAAIGFSQYLAAWIGKQSENMGDLAVFQLIFWICVIVGLPFIIFNKKLMKLIHGAE
ncbi:MAG: MFS transporter [Candidatus Amoebophilus sp. 36-38]|nr:MAG: MFS transporter [Candidatus Amoebophilus sp. 36-38]